jgi:hypothetical protein
MPTTVTLDADVSAKVKLEARRRGQSIKDLVNQILSARLGRPLYGAAPRRKKGTRKKSARKTAAKKVVRKAARRKKSAPRRKKAAAA